MSEELRKFIEKKLESNRMSIINLLGGAVIESLDMALDECIADVADLNKKFKVKRVVSLKIELIPTDEQRTLFAIGYDVDSKLAKRETGVSGTVAEVKVDGSKGVYAKERGSQQRDLPFESGKVTQLKTAK